MESLEGCGIEGSVDLFCPSELLVIHHPNSLEVSLLSSRLEALLGSTFTYVSYFSRGTSENIGREALRLKQFPRKSCTSLMLFLSFDEEGLLGWLPYSHDSLTQMAIFPSSAREEKLR